MSSRARIAANPRVVGASGGALKYSRTWSRSCGVDVQEQRRLAFGHRLHRRLFEVGGQRGQLAGELQQQLQFVLALSPWKSDTTSASGGRHASWRFAGLFPDGDGHPHGVAPLGP